MTTEGGENPLDMHRSMKTLIWDQPQSKTKTLLRKSLKGKSTDIGITKANIYLSGGGSLTKEEAKKM